MTITEQTLEELIKSHKYSRREFKNGTWYYYYDKHNNFGRITQCKSNALTFKISKNLSEKDKCKQVEQQAVDYINNVWLKDWKNSTPNDKSICMELRNKKVIFEGISYKHLKEQGGNSTGGKKKRTLSNMIRHLMYLPCAKEMLESSRVWTHARYEEVAKPYTDKRNGKTIVAKVYQTITGETPQGSNKDYVQVTVSKLKYSDNTYGNTVYISVVGIDKSELKKSTVLNPCLQKEKGEVKVMKAIHSFVRVATDSIPYNSSVPLHYNGVNKSINITISDLTEGNRYAKFEQLEKSLNGGQPEYIPADNTPRLGTINIKLKDYSSERIEKALRTMAMSLSVPLKAAKGEIFFYKAQEDLTDKWCMFFTELVRNTYDYVTEYLDLPKKTVMSKSDILTHKGKILYNPSTGEPIKLSDWNKFVGNLEKFLNRNLQDTEKKIILESKSLSKILDRMLKYNTLEAVKNLRLKDIEYHGKSFDWISENVKNMKDTFGESFTRQEQARIEVLQHSAAQKVTNISDKMRGNIKQILIDGVKNKQSKGQVSQSLFDKMVGDNRDFQRIADTEIQNAFNNSFVLEEVYNTEEGKKTYFRRIEVIDANTCPKCKAINGKIAVWSDKPLSDEISKDKNADYVIWEGKEGFEWECPLSVKHPYCRGTWARYDIGLDSFDIDALVAEQSKNAKKWNNAVEAARKEYKEKGIENPVDSTKGFTARINELYNAGDDVNKSLTYSGHKLQGRTVFNGLNISIENKKGTIRRGVDSDGHKWAIKMHYDYGYIRGTEGADGDHVDCYIGDNIDAKNVYIIHQKIPGTNKYDEDKCMLGFDTLADAKAAYMKQYDKSGFFGGVDTVPFDVFKKNVLMKKWHGKKLIFN